MSGPRLSRRHMAQILATALAGGPRVAHGQAFEQGIGGTGVVGDPKDEPSDQMIGGTGVVGTIRRFGSIYVNGLRITYADDLPVTQDGARIGTRDLKLGQVVRVAAAEVRGDLVARSIRILHEVVGPVERIGPDRITVLGQEVSLETKPDAPHFALGAHVAVSGLRRLDGTIVASLIEPVAPGTLRVAGPLVRAPNGAAAIGALAVLKVDPALIGRRVYVAGRKIGSQLVAADTLAERAALTRLGTTRLSLEGYVGRTATGLQLGSGLHVEGEPAASETEELAVITVMVKDKDHLVAEKVEPVAQPDPSSKLTPAEEREARERARKAEKAAAAKAEAATKAGTAAKGGAGATGSAGGGSKGGKH